jgi:hypothetical protein
MILLLSESKFHNIVERKPLRQTLPASTEIPQTLPASMEIPPEMESWVAPVAAANGSSEQNSTVAAEATA